MADPKQQKADVVALLREFSGPRYPDDICGKRCMGEAADEIERLRRFVQFVADYSNDTAVVREAKAHGAQ